RHGYGEAVYGRRSAAPRLKTGTVRGVWPMPCGAGLTGGTRMRIKTLAALSAAFMIGTAPLANAEELIVYHGWSSKAEVAALNILQEALNAKGHTWKDLAIPHNSGVNVSIVNMVTGG